MSEVIDINSSFDSLLDRAIELGSQGYRVFPLKYGTKEPAIVKWQYEATDDEDQIRAWFDNDKQYNLGLACGPQPNGLDLVAIDIDNHGKDGRGTWRGLVAQHGEGSFSVTPRHKTPNDGFHLLFATSTTLRNSRDGLGPGIDTRGDGGYIVLPPSRIIDKDGVFRHYTNPKPLWETEVLMMPKWMHQMLTWAPEPQPAPRQAGDWRPSGGDPDASPFDWARTAYEWETELVQAGWRYIKEYKGDSYWARPGKEDRGHSAVLHESGVFTVFSTEVPPQLENLGKRTLDGTGFSVSLPSFVVAYRFGGDSRAATADWGRQMRSQVEDLRRVAAPPSAFNPVSASDDVVPGTEGRAAGAAYKLPYDFWDQRPWLQHIRQAAGAEMVSPDALLITVLARYAAMVPVSYKLPGFSHTPGVGQGTLDFMGCIVARSGGGKSLAVQVADDLLPNPFDGKLIGVPVGSGEGLVQAFFVDEVDPESGKKTGKQVLGWDRSAFFTVDEGSALVATSKRESSTILQTLCTAWSGGVLGQTNASADRKRIIPKQTVRVSAVINMQDANGYKLFEEGIKTIGFTGRVIFASAIADIAWAPKPGELPEWPGELPVHQWPVIGLGDVPLTYDADVATEVSRMRYEGLVGVGEADLLKSQYLLARCKVSGLVALLEGRTHITVADWLLAFQIMQNSAAVLDLLQGVRRAHEQAAMASQVDREIDVEDIKETKAIERLAASIRKKLGGPDAPTSVGKLTRATTSAGTRHRFDPAWEMVLDGGGWSVEADGGITRQGGKK